MVELRKNRSKLLSSKPGAPTFEPRWPNAKAIKIGWLAGRGNGSGAIARILNDGTSPESVRTALQRAELERVTENKSVVYVPVRLTTFERTQLTKRAEARGIELGEWMRRVAVNAGIPDDLYNAIVEAD